MIEWIRSAFDGESTPVKNIALREANDEIERLREDVQQLAAALSRHDPELAEKILCETSPNRPPGAGELREHVNAVVQEAHRASTSAGWWDNTDIHGDRHVVPAKLCLIHSEISEAMEGDRKGLMDDHLPMRQMIEVELADAIIRIADLAGALGLDLGGAVDEKMAFNARRVDHKVENRARRGGKSY